MIFRSYFRRILLILKQDPSGSLLLKVLVRFATLRFNKAPVWLGPEVFIQETPVASGIKARIIVHIHIFYWEFLDRTIAVINNYPLAAKFIITTPNTEIKNSLDQTVFRRGVGVETILTKNEGRNFGPLFEALTSGLESYDYVVHAHSKLSPQLPQDQATRWADSQWSFLLESPEIILRTFAILEKSPNLQIAYALDEETVKRRPFDWGLNKSIATRHLNLDKNSPKRFPYPVGGMFIVKPSVLTNLNEVIKSKSGFPRETGQIDATPQHFAERAIGFIPFLSGDTHLVYFSRSDQFGADLGFFR